MPGLVPLACALAATTAGAVVGAAEVSLASPSDLTFEVRFAAGRRSFMQGEVIRLELVFASTTPDRYELDAATYDRSGRMSLESFELEPAEGAVDPLRDYFAGGIHVAGGLRSMPTLGAEPEVVEIVLNEWLRFERPGAYRLRVRTRRVAELQADGERDRQRGVELVAGPLELEIAPVDPAAAERAVEEAMAGLADPDPKTRQRACDVLRHAGGAAAIEPLADALDGRDDPCAFDAVLGLYAQPDRALVVERLEERLLGRDGAVGPRLVGTLAHLRWLDANPPPAGDDEAARRVWLEAQRDGVERLREIYLARLAAAVEDQGGSALATTLATLLESRVSTEGLRIGARLAPVFDRLEPRRQLDLLENHWPELADPAFVPVLERMAASPPEGHGSGRPPLDLVVLRLFDLAPEKARALVRGDVARAEPRLRLETVEEIGLVGLPPPIEASLVDRWELADAAGRDRLGALVARYASPALLPRVRKLYDEPWQAGAPHCWRPPFLAYFLRLDPALGRERLRQAIAMATADRDPCRARLLEETAAFGWPAELEEEVLAALDGADPDLARVAAEVLRGHGGAAAEAALWRRLERWSARWRGREAELAYRRQGEDPQALERRLGWELLRALLDGAGWALGRRDVERLADLCVGQDDCRQVDIALGDFGDQGEVLLTLFSIDPPLFQVARARVESVEALESRLARYPEGSVFLCWRNRDEADARSRELLRRLETFLAERGMGLVVRELAPAPASETGGPPATDR